MVLYPILWQMNLSKTLARILFTQQKVNKNRYMQAVVDDEASHHRWRCFFRRRPSHFFQSSKLANASSLAKMSFLQLFRRYSTRSLKQMPLPPSVAELSSKEAVTQARRWVNEFSSPSISLRDAVDLSFSRSSGPGGQVRCILITYWPRLHSFVFLECE